VPTSDGRDRPRRSNRRVSPRPRSPRGDSRARVIEFVAADPGSTAGDAARALGLNRKAGATRLARLAKSGELAKAKRGDAAPERASLRQMRRRANARRSNNGTDTGPGTSWRHRPSRCDRRLEQSELREGTMPSWP